MKPVSKPAPEEYELCILDDRDLQGAKLPKWRMEHEQFMQNLRYSRRLEKLEKEGGSMEDMKPPVNLLE